MNAAGAGLDLCVATTCRSSEAGTRITIANKLILHIALLVALEGVQILLPCGAIQGRRRPGSCVWNYDNIYFLLLDIFSRLEKEQPLPRHIPEVAVGLRQGLQPGVDFRMPGHACARDLYMLLGPFKHLQWPSGLRAVAACCRKALKYQRHLGAVGAILFLYKR
eukprot:CAMPEP_0180629240 /NCGR_PEP_ID=MMETSP1037_2-20121125/39359_1 /TAXON_ID=632150 /ORGANISM="Azadinium spinosum, Strain 3D9" /LENGTH=163 /DNA_ID=CAMNT_0022650035 /DNA_START=1857 /DNA_END=2348 /DNA_ORIENTATION=-